ncbi:MAG TPA: YdeI/OmpD-associated family protein [Verrucomicrobiae bacterium]|nr:YdeI/OmpD-associated family protein [Verrucomicrobiae bacterium]
MSTISFEAKLYNIGTWTILRLPEDASAKLPSRGQTMVKGTVNGSPFQIALEPDGRRSHWFGFDKAMSKATGAKAGDTVKLEIESTKEWPEPEVPADIQESLAADAKANALWAKITPMARWDWIRWIRATLQPETRNRRIETALSKLKHGERRPCCFNRTVCTIAEVSKLGVLLEPGQTARK